MRSWLAPADRPWVYEHLFTDVAPLAADATAVQGWVARRAAEASEELYRVDIASNEARSTLADQIVVRDGRALWIVLGDEVVEADDCFVRALPWKALEVAAEEHPSAALACAPEPT